MHNGPRDWHTEPAGEAASGGPPPGDPDSQEDWEEFEPGSWQDDVWDAFELDDEREDPEPEYGDFWPEFDDEPI